MGRHPTKNLNLPSHMRARMQKSGKIYYYYDLGGKPRKEKPLGPDYVLAVQQWAELNSLPAPVRPTVGYAIIRYLSSPTYAALSSGTQADYKFAIDKIQDAFGEAPLDDVEPAILNLYLQKRGVESKHRAQREIAVLGMIFRFARSIGLTKNDPKESVTLKKMPGRRGVYISDEMLEAVYQKAGDALKDAMDLAYYIGQRPADVLAMSKINIKDGVLEYRQAKTDMPQRIAIAGQLDDLLKRIELRKAAYKTHSLYLLVDDRGQKMTKHKLRARFEKAREDAGIAGKDFQFRDLRSKSGSDLKDQQGIESAQALLGHTSVTMTEHYTNRRRGAVITKIPLRK